MITVVPILRIAPTDGNMPLRTFQNRAHSCASVEKRTGSEGAHAGKRRLDGADLVAERSHVRRTVSTSKRRPRRTERANALGKSGFAFH